MQVRVINGNMEDALRKLKRALHDEGVIKEVLRRRFYEKPSEKRRRRHLEAVREHRRQQRLRSDQF